MKGMYLLENISGMGPIRATACTVPAGERVALLTRVEVDSRLRNRGYGTMLLKQVLADADRENVTLLLSVEPDWSPGCLNHKQLTAWYEKHGFYIANEDRSFMQRLPLTTNTTTTTETTT